MTDGMKTSEFYLAVASFVMGLLMLITGVVKNDKEMVDRGVNMIMAAVASYSLARGLKKVTIPGTTTPTPPPDVSNVDAIANAKGK